MARSSPFPSQPDTRPKPEVRQLTAVSPDWTIIFTFLALYGHQAQIPGARMLSSTGGQDSPQARLWPLDRC